MERRQTRRALVGAASALILLAFAAPPARAIWPQPPNPDPLGDPHDVLDLDAYSLTRGLNARLPIAFPGGVFFQAKGNDVRVIAGIEANEGYRPGKNGTNECTAWSECSLPTGEISPKTGTPYTQSAVFGGCNKNDPMVGAQIEMRTHPDDRRSEPRSVFIWPDGDRLRVMFCGEGPMKRDPRRRTHTTSWPRDGGATYAAAYANAHLYGRFDDGARPGTTGLLVQGANQPRYRKRRSQTAPRMPKPTPP